MVIISHQPKDVQTLLQQVAPILPDQISPSNVYPESYSPGMDISGNPHYYHMNRISYESHQSKLESVNRPSEVNFT